jgi:hypothetical protein
MGTILCFDRVFLGGGDQHTNQRCLAQSPIIRFNGNFSIVRLSTAKVNDGEKTTMQER